MQQVLRQYLTDALNPLVWRWPGNDAAKFYRFSFTEYSSVLDLTLAARLTPSTERASQYLRHLQDELKHTHIFLNRANKLRTQSGKKPLPAPDADYENLFERLGEEQFLAFVHLGEKRGCMQFTSYARYFARKGDTHTSGIFTAVLEDENHHMQYTYDLLQQLCGSPQKTKTALRKAHLWEARRSWMRNGKSLTAKLFFLIVLSVYPLLLPYKLLQLLRPSAPPSSGWSSR